MPQLGTLPPNAKIAIVSPSGWGNLGDTAIIESLIRGIRRRLPGAEILAFTQNPAATSREHGVAAYTCAGYSVPLYGVVEGEEVPADPQDLAKGLRGLRAAVVAARDALRGVPIRGTPRGLLLFPLRIAAVRAHRRREIARLRGASLVIVAGGGQLDEVWGGAFGHPYTLLHWGRIARAIGAKFVFASVGTGSLSWLGRFFVLRALRLASYRSYRDERSRTLLRAPTITREDPIVPDLAFALDVNPSRPPAGGRLVVGLSPMNYGHPAHWPTPDPARYQAHVRSFGRLAARILADGDQVVFFSTAPDEAAIADAVEAIGPLEAPARQRLTVARSDSLDALFRALERVDVVVAARLHGVVLPFIAYRPVLAVAHERKVRTLMEDVGQGRYCVDIDRFDPEIGYERLRALVAERARLTADIARTVDAERKRVVAQYDVLFGVAQPSAAASPETQPPVNLASQT